MVDEIRYDGAEGVATITLNRPDRLNALTREASESYTATLRRAAEDPDVRAIVVTGAGRGFCAGADLGSLARVSSDEAYRDAPREGEIVPELAVLIDKPVIAAVNGPTAGMGFAIMVAADIRFAAAGATITTSYAGLGLIAEFGISWLLPRIVGTGAALDLLLSSRRITAEEAFDMGLVQRVYPPDELLPAALGYARDLAENCAPRSLATIKRQVYADLHRPLTASMDESRTLMLDSFTWPEITEGLAAFREKRAPRFPAHPAAEGARPGG